MNTKHLHLLLAALPLLVGCGGYPAANETSGWKVESAAPSRTEAVLDVARLTAPCAISEEEWGGVVVFTGEDLGARGGFYTWYPQDVPRLTVHWAGEAVQETALAHEAGHAVWQMCGLTLVEDGAFQDWVRSVNAAVPADT